MRKLVVAVYAQQVPERPLMISCRSCTEWQKSNVCSESWSWRDNKLTEPTNIIPPQQQWLISLSAACSQVRWHLPGHLFISEPCITAMDTPGIRWTRNVSYVLLFIKSRTKWHIIGWGMKVISRVISHVLEVSSIKEIRQLVAVTWPRVTVWLRQHLVSLDTRQDGGFWIGCALRPCRQGCRAQDCGSVISLLWKYLTLPDALVGYFSGNDMSLQTVLGAVCGTFGVWLFSQTVSFD